MPRRGSGQPQLAGRNIVRPRAGAPRALRIGDKPGSTLMRSGCGSGTDQG